MQREKSPYRPWLLICEGFAACAVKEYVLRGLDSGRRLGCTEELGGFSNHHRFCKLILYIMPGVIPGVLPSGSKRGQTNAWTNKGMLGMVNHPDRNVLSILSIGVGGRPARRMVTAVLASLSVFASVSNFPELALAQNRQPPPRQTPNAGQPGKSSPQPSKPGFQPPGAPKPAAPVRKMSEEEKRKERVRALFADAANAQNNGAYPLALEQWQKLIKEFPGDPLASSARYYLGLCYQEQSPPDYPNAVGSFRKSLEDKDLKEQEEALVNLGWCLVQLGSDPQNESKAALAEASKVFASFLEKYPDSPSVDRAIFYAGEAESRLGNTERAVGFYNQLAQNKKLATSPLVPEALFA